MSFAAFFKIKNVFGQLHALNTPMYFGCNDDRRATGEQVVSAGTVIPNIFESFPRIIDLTTVV